MLLPVSTFVAPLAFSAGAGFAVTALALLAASAGGICYWQERRWRRLKSDFRKLRGDFTTANERAAGSRADKTQVLRLAVQNVATPVRQLHSELDALAASSEIAETHRVTLRQMRESLARVDEAIRALEDLQALENRSKSLALTSLNVGAIMLEAVAHTHAIAESKRVRLSVPAPSQTSLARADAELLRRALESLILDAIEVTPPRGTVALSVYQATDRVLLTISDEGPGTSVADQATLLDHSGNSRPPMQAQGARLNLAMVHNLVKAMDGWLWSQGEPGRGTTHVIELALAEQRARTASA